MSGLAFCGCCNKLSQTGGSGGLCTAEMDGLRFWRPGVWDQGAGRASPHLKRSGRVPATSGLWGLRVCLLCCLPGRLHMVTFFRVLCLSPKRMVVTGFRAYPQSRSDFSSHYEAFPDAVISLHPPSIARSANHNPWSDAGSYNKALLEPSLADSSKHHL